MQTMDTDKETNGWSSPSVSDLQSDTEESGSDLAETQLTTQLSARSRHSESRNAFDLAKYCHDTLRRCNANGKMLTIVEQDINRLEKEIQRRVSRYYLDENPKCDPSLCLQRDIKRSKDLNSRMEELLSESSELVGSIDNEMLPLLVDFKIRCDTRINEANDEQLAREMIQQLDEMDSMMKKITTEYRKKSYTEALRLINLLDETRAQIERFINSQDDFSYRQDFLAVTYALKIDLMVMKDNMTEDLMSIWRENVRWSPATSDEEAHLTVSLVDAVPLGQLDEYLEVLDTFNVQEELFLQFGTKLVNNFLKPLWKGADGLESKLSIRFDQEERRIALIRSPSSQLNVIKVADQLMAHLLALFYGEETSGLIALMGSRGQLVRVLFDSLVDDYLRLVLPTQQSDFPLFAQLVDDAAHLKCNLILWGFLDEDEEPTKHFTSFVSTLNARLAARVSAEYILKTRDIICRDMSLTRTLSNVKDPLIGDGLSESVDCSVQFFLFPMCQVSETTLEFLSHVKGILDEAIASDKLCATALAQAARNAMDLYIDLMPMRHEKLIRELPTMAAIFHNNCFYLAHVCQTLGSAYERKMKSLDSGSEILITFLDYVPVLRDLGAETLLSQLSTQQQMIVSFLQETDVLDCLVNNSDSNHRSVSTFRQAISKATHQLKLLSRSLAEVLPKSVFNLSIGLLLNALIKEFNQRISTIEDISADAATAIAQCAQSLIDEAPRLFRDVAARDLPTLVPLWMKFKEFRILLEANLQEIVDRWCDGQGPLAMYLSADFVRHFMRALFQNTERRAAAIAQIK